ncbi:double-CXXCG motif protein [Myxococcus sp. K38C18041901]|uniref:SitI6 family double-CXXCG motif immunity protein n=1 Tax=Myxococcus guangdongensis TaxID=2906760 RepID=UPI0020A77FCB|nr:double-CXXCG motif protein [Myxococcus guangdongensis]MCP3063898.1 double-CXXCG motif protein [Myxococcus guangdongensis]
MGRFFWVDEDREVAAKHGGEVHGVRKWKLPGLMGCPTCGATWAGVGHFHPEVDLSHLPEGRELERARPEPFQEFVRLRELVRPLVAPNMELPPGTGFGPFVGSASGRLPAFAWVISVLLVHREALVSLQADGVRNLSGHPTALKFRQKSPPELLELQMSPQGRLHPDCIPADVPSPCPTCGRFGLSRPEEPVLEAAALPTEVDLFRVGNFATMVIGTERFRDSVLRLDLDGLTFRELPIR